MASTVAFKLVTPERVVFDGQAELVIAVTTEGEEGILAKHAPFLAALRPGVLRANVTGDGAPTRLELATSEGFMQALPDRVTVLVDEALAFDDVVVADARAKLEAALERQKRAAPGSDDYAREQAAIDFANAQLRLTGHR
ncbi:MAG TPA: ATP synthase F1 subunit epsilon [Candidatus Cybelea sp.]|nr:ATP synthase F1 subunit epsilon [Candidatus Cybelea sp.]